MMLKYKIYSHRTIYNTYIYAQKTIRYAWDRTDDFGDKLANGVYLYKVNIRLNGQKLELTSTEADKFFTKEIGKMVLVR